MSSNDREGNGPLIGLCFIAASTLIVEITLTKFLSSKLFHHMTFAVLSMVILMFGAAGILCFAFPKWLGLRKGRPFDAVGLYACWYAIALCVAVPVFCFCPSVVKMAGGNPEMASWSLPFFFAILSVPFFFAGVCVSETLSISKRRVTTIYFADLLAAAGGVILCPILLPQFGGYGTIAIAAGLAVVGSFAYWLDSWRMAPATKAVSAALAVGAIALCLSYPNWAIKEFGTDIISPRNVAAYIALDKFGGIADTHWNAIARVDVTHMGSSNDPFAYKMGVSPLYIDSYIPGRLILLDGGCNTRQFRIQGSITDQKFLETSLLAIPYVVSPRVENALVIGGGGGMDILVAKNRRIPHVDVVEMNPATCRILRGELDDEDHAYSKWLQTDGNTTVKIINDEARHFSTATRPSTYDSIQLSGVDTLTAIQTGGMSLVENYLYTVDAIRNYARMLKPDGVLSIMQWRQGDAAKGPQVSMRLFLTYLAYLDSIGVREPWNHVAVIGTVAHADSLLKKSPFTHEELVRLRQFAEKAHYSVLFDPENRDNKQTGYDHLYTTLGFLPAAQRLSAMERTRNVPLPVTDDKPYFYSTSFAHASYLNIESNSALPWSLLLGTFLLAALLFFLPLVRVTKEHLNTRVYLSALYFAITGFAFLLYETAIIQLFTIFVGGPFYSLAVVLVSILAGYSAGSLGAGRMKPSAKMFFAFAAGLACWFAILYLALPELTRILLPLTLVCRLVICSAVSLVSSALIGMCVSLAMSIVRTVHGDAVAWMWGISSIFNALGAICFIVITMNFGISVCLLIVAAMYGIANVVFAAAKPTASMIIEAAKS